MVRLIVEMHDQETDPIKRAEAIQRDLFGYAATLDGWAKEVAATMLRRASAYDLEVWHQLGGELSEDTRKKLKQAGIGETFERLQREQVTLITSLPLEAAQKAHEWAIEAMTNGERYASLVDDINRLGTITQSRAICIARTETARARSNFTQARSEAVGSTHYIWHTVGDGSVRPRHAKLDGSVQSWASPPVCDTGRGNEPIRSHPGCVFNCRCWAEPLFPKSEYEE